jgi:hypothetical protein
MRKRSKPADHITFRYRSRDATRLLLGLIGLDIFFAAAYVFMFVWPGIPPEPHVDRGIFIPSAPNRCADSKWLARLANER